MTVLPKRKTIRAKNFDYNTIGTYFLTICVKDRKRMLSEIVGTGVLDGPNYNGYETKLTEYGKIADKYINQLNDFYNHISVAAYVIMPNHIHIMLHIADGPLRTPVPTRSLQNSTVSRFVSTFKRFCNKEYGENIWQIRSYDHIIRN